MNGLGGHKVKCRVCGGDSRERSTEGDNFIMGFDMCSLFLYNHFVLQSILYFFTFSLAPLFNAW